jgi:site-specific DNA-cytosine methylase
MYTQPVANPLTARMHKGVNTTMDEGQTMVAIRTDVTPKFQNDVAFTLTKPSPSGGGQPPAVYFDLCVRRMTPRECERLQGFPDDWTRISWRGKPPAKCPDGPRYRALGNSMAVNVMRWIGQRIEMAERILEETT